MAWIFSLLLVSVFSKSLTASPQVRALEVTLRVDTAVNELGQRESAVVGVRNVSNAKLELQHPQCRMAVLFVLTTSSGNLVPPVARGKVDPTCSRLILGPGEQVEHRFHAFEFVTGTAGFGYELTRGETYRAMALYRPAWGKMAPSKGMQLIGSDAALGSNEVEFRAP